MDARTRVHQLAMRFRWRAWLLFVSTFGGSLFLAWLGVWAKHQRG
jgi:hypothetical protein